MERGKRIRGGIDGDRREDVCPRLRYHMYAHEMWHAFMALERHSLGRCFCHFCLRASVSSQSKNALRGTRIARPKRIAGKPTRWGSLYASALLNPVIPCTCCIVKTSGNSSALVNVALAIKSPICRPVGAFHRIQAYRIQRGFAAPGEFEDFANSPAYVVEKIMVVAQVVVDPQVTAGQCPKELVQFVVLKALDAPH